MTAAPVFTIDLPDEAATAALAADIASALMPGDIVALYGDLGAGKTTLARALLRALAGDAELEVPSPTFTIVQTYRTPTFAVAHFDLYRLHSGSELDEIGFDDARAEGAVLVEWPDRAGDRLPAERLDVTLSMAGQGRRASISGATAQLARFERSRAARAFLEATGWEHAARKPIAGDASRRRYERVAAEGRRAILMDWPAGGQLAPDDPRRLYRARDLTAFLAVDHALREAGLSAPEIFASEATAGFAVMEDFGDERIADREEPIPERYAAAIESLAAIHNAPRVTTLTTPGGGGHQLPVLAGQALEAELTGFIDAYVPYATGRSLSPESRDEFYAAWRDPFALLTKAEQSWVLFDMQSPNLFWLAGRAGPARIGLIDFQDMFAGPSAYDVASLCLDARVTVPPDLESTLRHHYARQRQAADARFDAAAFNAAYAVCGALRTVKNLGAFARFAGTGNTAYIGHIPRLREYLGRVFAEPVLSPLAQWYDTRLNP